MATTFQAPSPSPAPSELPQPWIEYRTEDGTPYFHNPTTNETQWDRPVAPVLTPSPPSSTNKSPLLDAGAVSTAMEASETVAVKTASPVGSIRAGADSAHSHQSHASHASATGSAHYMMSSGMGGVPEAQATGAVKPEEQQEPGSIAHEEHYAQQEYYAQHQQQPPQEEPMATAATFEHQQQQQVAYQESGYAPPEQAAYGQAEQPPQQFPVDAFYQQQQQQQYQGYTQQAAQQRLECSCTSVGPALGEEGEVTFATTGAVAGTTITSAASVRSHSIISASADGWGEDDELFGGAEGAAPATAAAAPEASAPAPEQQQLLLQEAAPAYQPQPKVEQEAEGQQHELFGAAAPVAVSALAAPQQEEQRTPVAYDYQGQQEAQAPEAANYGGYTGFDMTPAPEVAPVAVSDAYHHHHYHAPAQPQQPQMAAAAVPAYTGFDMGGDGYGAVTVAEEAVVPALQEQARAQGEEQQEAAAVPPMHTSTLPQQPEDQQEPAFYTPKQPQLEAEAETAAVEPLGAQLAACNPFAVSMPGAVASYSPPQLPEQQLQHEQASQALLQEEAAAVVVEAEAEAAEQAVVLGENEEEKEKEGVLPTMEERLAGIERKLDAIIKHFNIHV